MPLIPTAFPIHRRTTNKTSPKRRELKGVKIGEHEHKVGQFADDTAAVLEGYEQSNTTLAARAAQGCTKDSVRVDTGGLTHE